jgi:BirA family biotin operon repressor/biotin-[acetyl-CoA-carboxylase] ligase
MTTKFEILTQLKAHINDWISGEQLSEKLGVSRTAVSNHMKNLKAEGYDIMSATKKGYRLHDVPDILTPDELRSELDTKIFGCQDIFYFQEIGSTNLMAKEYALNGFPEGVLVIAECQTQGRGRQHRYWHSPPNSGIYLSMILRPSLPPNETAVITLMTAVALAEAILTEAEIMVRIKWPNDLLVGGKKLSGILTEINTFPDSVDFVIVGVGINVNTPPEIFSNEIKDIATSLFSETGRRMRRARLVTAFLSAFEKYYAIFQKRQFTTIINRWKSFSNIIGKVITVDILGRRYTGKVVAVDQDGTLVIEDHRAKRHRLISGDIIESTIN